MKKKWEPKSFADFCRLIVPDYELPFKYATEEQRLAIERRNKKRIARRLKQIRAEEAAK